MKIKTIKYEILEEIVEYKPEYWVLRKVFIFGWHILSQLIGKDDHGEIPFENWTEANNKLNECVQNN